MNQYKTLREIDGEQYITVAEHEEIVKNMGDILKALTDARAAVQNLGKATSGLVSSLGMRKK